MIHKDVILEMFNKMDDDFKKTHKIQIKNILETYPCLTLSKYDLIGYAENEYNADPETIKKMVRYIENLDDSEMDYIARKLVTDPVMVSFWDGIENRLDIIKEKI
jgi:hypothetical protein